MGVVDKGTADRTSSTTVDRTSLHRVWKTILLAMALAVAVACYFVPVLLAVMGLLLVSLLVARAVYR
ncbi:MAG: class I SAM-dependent methyltransferase, partial [Actinomycetota bacterium]|nr:class I SAM-dependent methyltransferase [Actinomycetota bacterium]